MHFVVFIWGFTAILGKLLSIQALGLVWYRMLIALLVVFLFVHFRKIGLYINRAERVRMLLTGLIIAAHWVTFYHAIKISNVSVTLACISSGAFFAALFEPLIYKRKIIGYELLLGLSSVIGLTLIFAFETTYLAGIITAIISAALSALFAVINGRFAQKHNASVVTIYEMLGGLLGLSLFMLFAGGFNAAEMLLVGNDWLYLLVLAVICTAYPFIASIRLMKHLSPYTFVLTINMEPIYGIILAFFIFGESERMTGQFYAGTCIIIGTLFINSWLKYRRLKMQPTL
jgi:drug/metabolite transporter (DMT)-like permease